MMKQSQELANIPHIIITTPGRFVHQLIHDQANLKDYLENLQFLVFDEADRLLTDESFQSDLKHIMNDLEGPETRQTFLFSATMAKNYDKYLSKEELFGDKKPIECGLKLMDGQEKDQTFIRTVHGLNQNFILIPQNVKEAYLIYLIKNKKLGKNQQCIIFTQTCKNCHFLALLLKELGIECALIHSQLEQRVRTNNILKFKSSQCQYLIATDVASRGLDIPNVHLVLNYDVPKNPKDYVHRVGRTARAGRGGEAMTVVSQYDVTLIMAIEEYIGVKLTKERLDENEVLDDHNYLMKTMQVVRIKMSEQGLDDKFSHFKKQKQEMREGRLLGNKRTHK